MRPPATLKVDIARRLVNPKEFATLSQTEFEGYIKQLNDYKAEYPVKFQWLVLKHAAAGIIETLRSNATTPNIHLVDRLIDMTGLWAKVDGDFDCIRPRLQQVSRGSFRKKARWMLTTLFDDFIVPSIFAGEEEARLVMVVAKCFTTRFESDGGHDMDDEATEMVLQALVSFRSLRALSSDDMQDKFDFVGEVLDIWEKRGSSERTTCSLLADAIEATDYWREAMQQIAANPDAWKEKGGTLKAIRDIAMREMESSEEIMKQYREAFDLLIEAKATLPDEVTAPIANQLWMRVQGFWADFKQALETDPNQCHITLANMQEFFSYAQLAYDQEEELQDILSETASMMLSRDGDDRKQALLNACRSAAGIPKDEINSEAALEAFLKLRMSCDGAKGLEISVDMFKSTLESFIGMIRENIMGSVDMPGSFLEAMRAFAAVQKELQILSPGLDALHHQRRLLEAVVVAEAWPKVFADLPEEVAVNDYIKVRQVCGAAESLKLASSKLSGTEWGEAKNHMQVQIDKAMNIHKAFSDLILQATKGELEAKALELDNTANMNGGKPWDDGIPRSAPWQVLHERYKKTLEKLDIDKFSTAASDMDECYQKYIKLASAFGQNKDDDLIQRIAKISNTIKVTKVAAGLMKLFLKTPKPQPMVLRRLVYNEIAPLTGGDSTTALDKIAFDLPPQLRSKVVDSIQMRK